MQENITTLDEYMAKHLPYRYQITITDNGSQDKTLEIAKNLAERHRSVRVASLAERGSERILLARQGGVIRNIATIGVNIRHAGLSSML